MQPDDRLSKRDVTDSVLGGRARRPVGRHTVIELDELALEGGLVRDPLDRPPCPRRLQAPTLQDELGWHVAQKRRGKDEGRALLWVEERELLSVLGDAIHQVDPVHGRRRLWKFEED